MPAAIPAALLMISKESAAPASFTSYGELTKQILTLSTGILALTVTFADTFVDEAPPFALFLLGGCWISLFVSLIGGVMTLMSLTGILFCLENPNDERCKHAGTLTIYAKNIRATSLLQVVTFLLGAVALLSAGAVALG